jgi:anti-sigma regulatory factor (Ser/Thr protein kinase)
MMVVPVTTTTALIAGVDVAGHGATYHPALLYVLGWLHGRVAAGEAGVAVDALARALEAAMQDAGIEASFFLALITGWPGQRAVRYEAIARGYPPPLLLTGRPARSMETIPEPPAAGGTAGERPVLHDDLRPPWRLIVASDGLLSRLGGGVEQDGRRLLRRWQLGSRRDLALSAHLDSPTPPNDDESLLAVVWDGWDEEVRIPAEDDDAIKRLARIVRARATTVVGQTRAEDLTQAVVEAIDNAREHGQPPGRRELLWIGFCQEEGAAVVEVRDRGRGVSPSQVEQTGRGFDVMRRMCELVDVRSGESGGTTVTLVVRGDDHA